MKFKTGTVVNGERQEGVVIEHECWFDALDAVLAEAGIYLHEIDEEGNEVA